MLGSSFNYYGPFCYTYVFFGFWTLLPFQSYKTGPHIGKIRPLKTFKSPEAPKKYKFIDSTVCSVENKFNIP